MKKLLRFILLLSLSLGGSIALRAQETKQTHPIHVLDFNDPQHSASFRSMRLAERFRMIVRSAVPGNQKSWNIRFEQPKGSQGFSLNVAKGKREVRICVPDDINLWKDDATTHAWFMSVCVLCQMGEKVAVDDPAAIKNLSKHWLVRGLAAKAAREQPISPYPFSNPFYQTYVLTAAGFYPTVNAMLQNVPPLPRSTALQRLDSEYAELFVMFLSNIGFFRTTLPREILQYAILLPEVPPADVFAKLTETALKKKITDGHFQDFLNKNVITYFTPINESQLEKRYCQIVSLSYMGKDGQSCTCALRDFPLHRDKMKDPDRILDDVMLQFNLLHLQVPPQFRSSLSAVRMCVSRFRTDWTPEAQVAFCEAEQAFFSELDFQIQANAILNRAERKCKPVGLRMLHTMDCISYPENYDAIPSSVNQILDRLDDYRR